MPETPMTIPNLTTIEQGRPDDVFILSASWEQRCLGMVRKSSAYSAKLVLMNVYDGESKLREKHIREIAQCAQTIGPLKSVEALHSNPLGNVRHIIQEVLRFKNNTCPKITIDISTFTRKHLLQLLHGLDISGLLESCQLVYTESEDFHTPDDEPISQGISSIKAIDTFTGSNSPSKDTLLVLFLGYEGRRALALWEHLEPNVTLAIIGDPPSRVEWAGRTESQNQYLLSSLPQDRILGTDALNPKKTYDFLETLFSGKLYSPETYNYRVASLGTKSQLVGLYRFWRRHPGEFTIFYASPIRYREERANFPPGKTWLLDNTITWTRNRLEKSTNLS